MPFFCSDRIGTRENCTTINFGFVSLFCLLLQTLWQIYISISLLGSCQSEMTTLCVLLHPQTISLADEMRAFFKNFTSALCLHFRHSRLLHFLVDLYYISWFHEQNLLQTPVTVKCQLDAQACGCSILLQHTPHHQLMKGEGMLDWQLWVNHGTWSCCFEFRVR